MLSFSATNLHVTPLNWRLKPKICRLNPVICRPAQEHSRHEPVMDCRPEPPCVVTDIPKREKYVHMNSCADPEGPSPLKNHKNIAFLAILVRIP